MITVSMPTYDTPPELLARAIDSVLSQTYRDIRLVVVNDGGAPIAPPSDPRVIVHDLSENRGRYFADAVVLGAIDDGWFATHDSDDWAEPRHFAELVKSAGSHGAAIAPYWRHRRDGRTLRNRTRSVAPAPNWRYVGHTCASIATVERWQVAGGVHPGYRLGFDTLHLLLLTITGDVGVSANARYHWCQRHDSLTGHPSTNHTSRARLQARTDLRRLWAKTWQARPAVAETIRADIPASLIEEVGRESEKLRANL